MTIITNGICTNEPVLEIETQKNFWDFEIQSELLIAVRRLDRVLITEKKRTCYHGNFANHRVKLKESDEVDKCIDLAIELKKNEEHRLTMIPIVTGAF